MTEYESLIKYDINSYQAQLELKANANKWILSSDFKLGSFEHL